MSFSLDQLLRENIKNMKPYSSARDEYKGNEGVFLDANENSLGSVIKKSVNRYPDPLQWEIKKQLAPIKQVDVAQIFLGNGSDEPIDLLIRAFCNPGKDRVLILPPTYGMYEVSAHLNDVILDEAPLTTDFDINVMGVMNKITPETKIIFVCSPNNPTGNLVTREKIRHLLKMFNGIVVVDEAYIDFSKEPSFTTELNQYPNLVVLQTFSKAWGLAALRLGVAYASKALIEVLNKIKPPYNINQLTQEAALEALNNIELKNTMVEKILSERAFLIEQFKKINYIIKIYPTDSNFILIKVSNGKALYDYLVLNKIITRDRSKVLLCEGCVRITVGTHEENCMLLQAMIKYQN
jgi:histidinol-phosphate aminotransferase